MISLRSVYLCVFLLAGGCALAHPKPEVKLYHLQAESHVATCAHPFSLKVSVPRLAPGLDKERIAVAESANHLSYYTGAAWTGELSDVLHSFLIDSLSKSGAFTHVSTDLDTAKADRLLHTYVQEFQVDQASSQVKIRLTAQLMDAQTRIIKTSIPVEKSLAATGSMEQIVVQFNQAMNEAAAQIVDSIVQASPSCTSPVARSSGKAQKD